MPKTKVAVSIDAELLKQLDRLVQNRQFANRSAAIEIALADKLERLGRVRLARECARLTPRHERTLANEGLAADFAEWPEY